MIEQNYYGWPGQALNLEPDTDVIDLSGILRYASYPDMEERKPRKYPFTDVGVDDNENLFIDVALPGFTKDDIEIERIGEKLHIRGAANFAEEIVEEYFEQNIVQDDFERIIVIDDKYQAGSVVASMADGLLTIMIEPQATVSAKIEIK